MTPQISPRCVRMDSCSRAGAALAMPCPGRCCVSMPLGAPRKRGNGSEGVAAAAKWADGAHWSELLVRRSDQSDSIATEVTDCWGPQAQP